MSTVPPLDDQPVARPAAPPPSRPARRAAAVRLGGLLVTLVAFALIFFVGGVIGTDRVRGWVEPLGWAGPLLYVPVSAVLGTLFVPGAALAAAAGLLFGPWVGALAALAAGTCGALLSRWVSSRAGRPSFEVVAEGRTLALAELARRHGLFTVIVARLAPWLPDAIANHAFGIAGLRAREVGFGHLIAAGPRALAYAIVGAHSGEPTGTGSLLGWGLNLATGCVGAALLFVVIRRHRRATAEEAVAAAAVPAAPAAPAASTERLSGGSTSQATGE